MSVLAIALLAHQPTLTPLTVVRDASQAQILVPAPGGSLDVESPLTIRVEAGTLVEVDVVDQEGHPVSGSMSEDGTAWVSDAPELPFGVSYAVRASAIDDLGVPATFEQTLSTTVPEGSVQAIVSPWSGSRMGVGMPITIDFSSTVENKAAVEERLSVQTDVPVSGAWSWTSDTQIAYRPESFWPGNTSITVTANLRGVEAAPGVFADQDHSVTWRTLPAQVIYVDATSLTLTFTRDGRSVKRIPVTVGKDGFDTMSGTKVVMTREPERIMDTATAGVPPDDPNAYRVKVKWAMRLTWSGEFFHASPWAEADWGVRRSSHGCISMSESNAQWLFENTNVGDPVVVTGTAKQQDAGNGITVWNVPWDEWIAGSAR